MGQILGGFTPGGRAGDIRDLNFQLRTGSPNGIVFAGIGFVPVIGDGAKEIIKRSKLSMPDLDLIKSQKLVNAFLDFYKGIKNPIRIGNGSTADAIRYELSTGKNVFGKSHIMKGYNIIDRLENMMYGLSDNERKIAKDIIDDIKNALDGS